MPRIDNLDKIVQVANLSHPVDATISSRFINIFMSSIALNRDIILDIDLPENRPSTLVSVEKDPATNSHGVLLSFTPRPSDFVKVADGSNETDTEFIFIGKAEKSLINDHSDQFLCRSSGLFGIDVSRKQNFTR